MNDSEKLDALLAIFAVAEGSYQVTFNTTDEYTGDPIVGVEISIWNSDLSVPVVPLVRTTTGGTVNVGLPEGVYNVFCFKPYSSFIGSMPYVVTVVDQAVSQNIQLSQVRPALPTAPRITLFGWVLRADLTPVTGAEVRLRILSTPQLVAGGAGLSKFDLIGLTDTEGRFEIYPIGGINTILTCDQVGYSRKGRLPNAGSLNWSQFGVENI
jgi:hypothetical protein